MNESERAVARALEHIDERLKGVPWEELEEARDRAIAETRALLESGPTVFLDDADSHFTRTDHSETLPAVEFESGETDSQQSLTLAS